MRYVFVSEPQDGFGYIGQMFQYGFPRRIVGMRVVQRQNIEERVLELPAAASNHRRIKVGQCLVIHKQHGVGIFQIMESVCPIHLFNVF